MSMEPLFDRTAPHGAPEFRAATVADADAIAGLVNKAYRPASAERGWTHEADLVAGERTSAMQVAGLLRPDSTVLLLLVEDTVSACVHVERSADTCSIGMLATEPKWQNRGLGKRMLEHAERFAVEVYAARRLRMSVLSSRPELLAFYERRGYAGTGEQAAYPVGAGVGTPRSEALHVLSLEKMAI